MKFPKLITFLTEKLWDFFSCCNFMEKLCFFYPVVISRKNFAFFILLSFDGKTLFFFYPVVIWRKNLPLNRQPVYSSLIHGVRGCSEYGSNRIFSANMGGSKELFEIVYVFVFPGRTYKRKTGNLTPKNSWSALMGGLTMNFCFNKKFSYRIRHTVLPRESRYSIKSVIPGLQ